jgi:hypothetical protein
MLSEAKHPVKQRSSHHLQIRVLHHQRFFSGGAEVDLHLLLRATKVSRYIVNIKSGPNWGNSSQVKKMIADFKSAQKTLRTSNSGIHVTAVNGCCYGRDRNPDKGDYFKYCGQDFRAFISGEKELYTEIIEPLGHKAQEKNAEFQQSYAQMLNRFTLEFGKEYCDSNGAIDWPKLVRFNSSAGRE